MWTIRCVHYVNDGLCGLLDVFTSLNDGLCGLLDVFTMDNDGLCGLLNVFTGLSMMVCVDY